MVSAGQIPIWLKLAIDRLALAGLDRNLVADLLHTSDRFRYRDGLL
jgi:hypothetical protein